MEKPIILLVDDDRNIRRIYELHLRKAGYEVMQADSGQAAIEQIDRAVPDAVLLDINMSGMDGFATIRAIRAKEKLLNVPVLFLTSTTDQSLKIKALLADSDDYILKSTLPEELIARVAAALRRTDRIMKAAGKGRMTGHLDNITLSDLLQGFANAGQTASITFPEMDANVYLEEGQIVHAARGGFAPEDSLQKIFFEARGPFTVSFDTLPPNIPKNPLPTLSTLMNVLSYVDEVMATVKKLHLDERSANIDYELAEYSEFMEFRDRSPITCIELIASMKGNLKQNLKNLVTAVKDKEIYLVTTGR